MEWIYSLPPLPGPLRSGVNWKAARRSLHLLVDDVQEQVWRKSAPVGEDVREANVNFATSCLQSGLGRLYKCDELHCPGRLSGLAALEVRLDDRGEKRLARRWLFFWPKDLLGSVRMGALAASIPARMDSRLRSTALSASSSCLQRCHRPSRCGPYEGITRNERSDAHKMLGPVDAYSWYSGSACCLT